MEEEQEEVVEESSQEDDDGKDASGRRIPLHDSIDVESDARTASEEGSFASQPDRPGHSTHDLIDADSLGPIESWGLSSPEERERDSKRRKLSISPVPEPGLSAADEMDDDVLSVESPDLQEYAQDNNHIGSLHEDEESGENPARGKASQQPIFHPPPRFKPVEADSAMEGLPAAFSPQRGGAKYIHGGLAAELQGWLSEVKDWEGLDRSADFELRITVTEIRPGRRMYLVRALYDSEDVLRRFILAGEGKLTGLGRRAELGVGSVVVIGQPIWDVEVEDETWTVACDWRIKLPVFR